MQSRTFKIIIAAAILVCVVVLLQLCSPSEDIRPIEGIGPLKEVIKEEKLDKDSIHKEVIKLDSAHKIPIAKFRKVKAKKDSLPCPEILNEVFVLTDSIIVSDSTLIKELYAELFIANLIIANQDTIIKRDSVVIAQKDKEIRKQKRWKKFWKTTTVVAAGLNLTH